MPFVLFSTLFFFLGAVFSHYVAFPWTWKFFISFQTDYMQFMPKIGPAFSLYVKMMLGFGLIFQMPTLVFFLSRMGLVSAGLLTHHFKYAVLVIFIIAAVISPGTDVMSQLMMAIPMLGLYALSILVAFFFGRSAVGLTARERSSRTDSLTASKRRPSSGGACWFVVARDRSASAPFWLC